MSGTRVWEDFARYLLQNKNAIVSQFAAAVSIEPNIPSADYLSKVQVVNYMSKFVRAFAEELCMPEGVPHAEKVEVFGRAHGRHRWKQFYHIEEVIREFAILRQVLMFHFAKFQKAQLFAVDDQLSINKTLHRLLDDIMLVSVREFTAYVAVSGQVSKTPVNSPSDPTSVTSTAGHSELSRGGAK